MVGEIHGGIGSEGMKNWTVHTVVGEANLEKYLDGLSAIEWEVFSIFRWTGPLGQENFTVVSSKQEAE